MFERHQGQLAIMWANSGYWSYRCCR